MCGLGGAGMYVDAHYFMILNIHSQVPIPQHQVLSTHRPLYLMSRAARLRAFVE